MFVSTRTLTMTALAGLIPLTALVFYEQTSVTVQQSRLIPDLTFGYIELDNPGFVEDDFYKRTMRVSTNLFWTPTGRFDVGAELLWGMREDEGGDASQFQFATRYLF